MATKNPLGFERNEKADIVAWQSLETKLCAFQSSKSIGKECMLLTEIGSILSLLVDWEKLKLKEKMDGNQRGRLACAL